MTGLPEFQKLIAASVSEAANAGSVPYQFATLSQEGLDAIKGLMTPTDSSKIQQVYDQVASVANQYKTASQSDYQAKDVAVTQANASIANAPNQLTAVTQGTPQQATQQNVQASLTSMQNVDANQLNQMAEQLYDSNLVQQQKQQLKQEIQTQLNNQLSSLNVQEIASGNMASSRAGVAEGLTRKGSAEALAKGNAEIDNTARTNALTQAQAIIQQNQNFGYQANTQNAAINNAVNQLNEANRSEAERYNINTGIQQQQFNANTQNEMAKLQEQLNQANQQFNAGQLTQVSQANAAAANAMGQFNQNQQFQAYQANQQNKYTGIQGQGAASQMQATLGQYLSTLGQTDAQRRLAAAQTLQQQQQSQNDVARQNQIEANQPMAEALKTYSPYFASLGNLGIIQQGNQASTGASTDISQLTGQQLSTSNTATAGSSKDPTLSDALKTGLISSGVNAVFGTNSSGSSLFSSGVNSLFNAAKTLWGG